MSAKMPTFTFMVIMSTMLVAVSTNTLFVWVMLELNMLTFIPMMHTSNSTLETESSIKYLIPQSFGSGLFMAAMLFMPITTNSKILSTTALIMKLGGAPLHSWFPITMQSINLIPGFILTTWQKLAPLVLLTIPHLAHTPLIIFSAIMSALWGSMAGLSQTNLLKLMAFSSINHLSWLMMASTFNLTITLIYLMSYSLSALPVFLYMQTPKIMTYKTTLSPPLDNHTQLALIMSVLSLASLPPLAMFLNKLPIIALMTKTNKLLMPLSLLLLGATISLYFYLSLVIMLTLNFNSLHKPTYTKNSLALKPTMYTLSMMFQCSALFLWLSNPIS
uniref:NADH-ubiquinone oxidoreductase chain 2 n=1 Tax=Solenaia carinata TaxID=1903492 RepID=V9NEM6_9BIVA|nr:NADH dehydrogenase subunit 2 [Solenaia carinata]